MEAVKRNGYVIEYIKNPSEKVKKEANEILEHHKGNKQASQKNNRDEDAR